LKLPGVIVKTLKNGIINSDLIIFCTPMSEYKKLIIKINNIYTKTLITDIGSSKIETLKLLKNF
jgi:prephenate dehydrogenase/cyclohexadieny/prephenate dehydrogenase